MCAFECQGWMNITIDDLTTNAEIKIQHKDDHVPYFVIALPEGVKNLIISRRKETVTQVCTLCQSFQLISVNNEFLVKLWNEIIKLYPIPKISRKAVQYLWSRLNETDWKRDEDQLVSARKLLKEAEEAHGLGSYHAQIITLPTEDERYSALAWCLPDMHLQWGGRIREVALDSACAYHKLL